MPLHSLEVAGSVIVESQGGPLVAEHALFDPGDIELSASEPGANREVGYHTTAGAALERLAALGITPQLAAEAHAAARPLLRTYALGLSARRIVERLEPSELFAGRAYYPATGLFEGVWVDVGALAQDLAEIRPAGLLQMLWLSALLARLPEGARVAMVTADPGQARRPGERTLRRPEISGVSGIVEALGALRPVRPPAAAEAGQSRRELATWLGARARAAPGDHARLESLVAALTAREPPVRGPLAETSLWSLEEKLLRGDTAGVGELVDGIERYRGRTPGTMYLRAHLSLVGKTEEPRALAVRISELSTSMTGFHELELLSARAWLAAGDERRARAFARDLLDNASADDAVRALAFEVIEAILSGPGSSVSLPRVDQPPPAPMSAVAAAAPASSYPPGGRTSAATLTGVSSQSSIPRAPPAARPFEPPSSVGMMRARSSATMRSLPPGVSQPPFRVEARAGRDVSGPAPLEATAERAETLPAPPGFEDVAPPPDEAARTPTGMRLTCTYLARELGRELRVRHGVGIRADVDGLEAAQRYLREALVEGRVRTPEEEREVMRVGALVAEILARRLGGQWVELNAADPGRWGMLVPARSRPEEVIHVWPFGRVQRFVVMAHRERDLVSYYLDLEARCR